MVFRKDDILEGSYCLVSREEEIEFRKKYKLSVIEAEAVLYQKEYSLTAFEKGRTYKLYNEAFVREMIDDEEKFKEHIENLYKEGKIIKRIYAKVFTKDVLKNKETVNEEKFKYFNQDVAKRVLEFQRMFNITDSKLMHIFDLKRNEIELLKKGIFVDDKKAQFMNEALDNKEKITELLRKRVKEGKLSSNPTYNLIDEIAIYCREEKENNRDKLEKRYSKKVKEEKKESKENEENTENKEKIKKVISTNSEKASMKFSELTRIRHEAKRELESEYKGLTDKTYKRDLLVEALYEQYSNNEKISSNDINVIKETMMLHENMVSSYTLKIVIIGSLRTEGYEVACKNINELISTTKDQNYKVKLIKFRKNLDDEYKKMRIEEMRKEGHNKYEIIKELNLTTKDFWRLVDEGR